MLWSISSKGTKPPVQSEAAMSETVLEDYASLVSQTVESRRKGRGLKAAIYDASRILGLTERRVRACLYREIRSVKAAEWLSVRARFAAHLEAEERRYVAEAELLRARIKALRKEAA
ncbi:MAG: hypothetical protein ABF932_09620 [Gluconobacter potus]|uniref:Uncharacterized protein n=2 Tax=Gluconobacter TaxID=441 RepID=A0A829X181_GLUOY|nr:hypothetical protein [Gluconobacter oxydans]GEM17884.1 hypothetical protein NBRC3293_2381 [Gluconobacter oxydans NBRC 3293]